jgi:hypothetical protein
MGRYGGGKENSPGWALVRPALMLVVGLVAGLLMLQLLMRDPGIPLR